jgi:GT2 family glycosyltransferase
MSDDDTTPRPDWLVLLRAAADAHPEVGVIVGTVRPRFEVEPPAWMLAGVRRGPAFGWVEREADGFVDPTEGVGPSVAIRKACFDAGLRFDESIGPNGTASYAMGSETELLLRLQRAGVRAWYVRGAVVEHHVTAAQVTVPSLLSRAYRYGRGRWRLGTSRLASARLRVGGVPLSLLFDLIARRRTYQRARRRGDQPRALMAAWRIAYLAGHVDEIRRARGGGSGLGAVAAWIPPSIRDALVPGVASEVVSPTTADSSALAVKA